MKEGGEKLMKQCDMAISADEEEKMGQDKVMQMPLQTNACIRLLVSTPGLFKPGISARCQLARNQPKQFQ